MVGCNADGSEKLPLLVIGKSLKPRCFKNVKKLPVEYRANKRAWMTSKIFTEWLVSLEKHFTSQKRKIVLIIDNCPAHPCDLKLMAIKLVFLPPNTTSVLQPCDQGIIQNLKFQYRKLLLRKYLATIEGKKDFCVNVLDACNLLRTAWNLVTPTTIQNCFAHARFILNSETEQPEENEIDPTLSEMFNRVSSVLNVSISLNEYVTVDENVTTAPVLTDTDIVETVQVDNCEGDDSDDELDTENDSENVPTATDMLSLLSRVGGRYFEANSEGEMFEHVDKLEQFVENKIVQNCVQKKITDYFK